MKRESLCNQQNEKKCRTIGHPICRTDGGEISEIGQTFPVYLSIICFVDINVLCRFLLSNLLSARVYSADILYGYLRYYGCGEIELRLRNLLIKAYFKQMQRALSPLQYHLQ